MSRSILLLALIALFHTTSLAADETAGQCWNMYEEVEQQVGYCQAVRSGNTLHIAGTIGAGEMPTAIKQAYDQLLQTLNAHGLGFEDVVKETVFTTDIDALVSNMDVRKQYFANTFPASSWVQVQRLFKPEFVIEVELTAEFPE